MASSVPISSTQVSLPAGQAASDAFARKSTAEDLAKSDLWIFREGRRTFSGQSFLRELQQRLAIKGSLLNGLIQAGELEAALADAGALSASLAASLTDSLACQLWAQYRQLPDVPPFGQEPEKLSRQIEVPDTISVSPPEGFTYYALQPLDFAKTAEQVFTEPMPYAVIGIRSIGTTLSAVVNAALLANKCDSSRITVRPTGHPYDRSTQFSSEQEKWIRQQQSRGAHFVIVDEGPGRSGSTFLSVAEALCRAGISPDRITILGSRPFSTEQLCAQDAALRWQRFRFVAAQSSFAKNFTNWTYIGGGDWRKHFCFAEHEWPESWTQMERFKMLSPDGREFLKFEGMGRIGHEAKQRAFALAEAGLSPTVADARNGFLSYAAIHGRHLRKEDLTASILEQIASYCSFRVNEFCQENNGNSELEQMLVHNVQQEFGRELKTPAGQLLDGNHVLVDGRMQPHEWIADGGGALLKTDAISHGDNHFFPGPCSIAWDLAGAVIEWGLGSNATDFLLGKFRQFSGVDISQALNLYMLAYCVFRLGFCKMARVTVLGTEEEKRLDFAYQHYRGRAEQLLDLVIVG